MTAVLVATLFVAVAIGAFRLHPFLALLAGAVLAGSLTPGPGSAAERVLAALDESAADFGQVVGAIGIAIALAAIILPGQQAMRRDVAGLRERMARLEGLFEGFTLRERETPAG